jgi:hypothetical protein
MTKRTYRLRIEPWSAVRIAPGGEACVKAVALHDKRFLGRDAPALPLKGCTRSAACTCIYRHYVDRRAGPRRDAAPTAPTAPTAARPVRAPLERRAARGRRGSD